MGRDNSLMWFPEKEPVNASKFTDRGSLFGALPKGGAGVEVGVQRGEFSAELLRAAQPQVLFLVDCWQAQAPEAVGHDETANVPQEVQDALYASVLQRFANYSHVMVIRDFSAPAASRFKDAIFDWVYIDANHLRCYDDMVAWWPKVKPGGYMLGHDYMVLNDCITVKPAVDLWALERNLKVTATVEDYPNWLIYKGTPYDA